MNKNIILILVFTLGIVLGIFEFMVPIWSDTISLGEDLKNAQAELKNAQAVAERIQVLSQKYDAMSEDTAKINAFLPGEQDLPGIISTIKTLASNSGIILESINFQAKKSAGEKLANINNLLTYNSVGVQLNASASKYGNFKNFLEAMAANLRLFDIDTISFGATDSKLGDYDLNINLLTYYKP